MPIEEVRSSLERKMKHSHARSQILGNLWHDSVANESKIIEEEEDSNDYYGDRGSLQAMIRKNSYLNAVLEPRHHPNTHLVPLPKTIVAKRQPWNSLRRSPQMRSKSLVSM